VIDATTGEVRTELLGLAGGTWDYDFFPGTTLLATASSQSGETVIFQTSPLATVELDGWVAPLVVSATVDYSNDGERVVVSDGGSYITARAVDGGEPQLVEAVFGGYPPRLSENGRFVASKSAEDGPWVVRTTDSGEMTYQAPAGWGIVGLSADGTQALIVEEGKSDGCDPRLVSTIDGSVTTQLVDGDCWLATFSADGKLIYTATRALEGGGMGLFDSESGELLGTPLEWARFGFGPGAAFTADGSTLVASNGQGSVFIFDVAALVSGARVDDALIREIAAHDSSVLRLKVSPDGSMAATWAFTEPLKVWELDTGQLVGQFGGKIEGGTFHDADFHPSLPWLVVTSPPDEVRIHTLDLDELVLIAVSRLSRDMTEGECQQYFREPCPGS
jgi:WD40 repeat protein